MKHYVIGSINMDLVIQTPYIPEAGETMSGSNFVNNPGGKGANQAVAISKLGGNAFMVGMVGESFGDELISTLAKYKVNTDNVIKLDGISSGVAIILIENGDNRIILDAGSNAKITHRVIDEALKDATSDDYLVCQLEIPQEAVLYAFKKAKQLKMKTVLNPSPAAELMSGILERTDYIIVNQTESEFYTGLYPEDEKSALECASRFQSKGVKNIVITMGTHGSIGISNNECVIAKSYKVKAIDTTAAGDTYLGAFVVQISNGKSLYEAMDFASKASSITCTRVGAQQAIPTLEEIK